MVDINTQFGGFLTALGAAQDANSKALGIPWKLTHMLIGDANGADPVPAPGQTALVNQVYRAQLNQLYVSPVDANVLIAELVLPPNVGGWWIRELALEDEDGVFSAVANCAPSYKPVLAQGSGRNQVVRMHVITSGTANIQLKIDPSVVLATRAYCDGLVAAHGAADDPHPQYELRGAVTTIAGNTALSAVQLGLVHADASAVALTATLPPSNAALGVRDLIVRRTDNTGNRLTVRAAVDDRIKFHTDKRAEGYPFFYLLGAGDYWHLRSDGAGSWWLIGRLDGTALGRPVFETTTRVSPGGWGVFAGTLFSRLEWPWLWDHAEQSGMLNTEASRVGMEGGWTIGDGVSTFRGPEGRGEFLRVLDDGRGIDLERVPGSWKKGSLIASDAGPNIVPVSPRINRNGQSVSSLQNELGFDALTGAGYNDAYIVSGPGNTGYSSVPGTDDLVAGAARPRNIAYPGRIKLI
ncbi:phage tail protein [Stutzerimonas nitrititolerans]|uniref:phage tail protein n=1 Tax=Stutzerimonas nitrititolerans TaxID=2482751 RepID=UPI0028AFB0BA|nr:phage tail protein [Stutzerimonas nitrititolerans]